MSKIIIDSNKKRISLNFQELYDYKDLFLTFVFRDLKVRYANTFLGFLWVFIQPVVTLGILIIVYNKVIQVNTGNVPYPLFTLAGMCAWNYFAFVAIQAGSSLISAQNMIHKIYFPRLIIPLSKAVVGLVDLGVILFLFFLTMVLYGYSPQPQLIFLPVFVLLTIVAALAAGIWISALTIRFRDIQMVIPFLIQMGFYFTPIAFPATAIPEKYKLIFYLNPMTAVVQGVRWSLVGIDPPTIYSYVSFVVILIMFIAGLFYFRRVEKVMADIL
jgi:lipopolysaccharide transport system permease protein